MEDPCVFYKMDGEDKIIIGMHVDDGIHIATSQHLIDGLITDIQKKFGKITHQQGKKISFLGLWIQQADDGAITVSQPGYIEEILSEYENVGNTAVSPATRDILEHQMNEDNADRKKYLSKVMKLMYLATKTRPDLLFATSYLASKSACPTIKDEEAVRRIYSYLEGTRNLGIVINPNDMQLSSSVDASKGIHRSDEKGHSGMTLLIGGSVIFSRSSKQRCIGTSATHCEVLALYDSLGYILSVRNLLIELGYNQDKPTPVQQDNSGAITVYKQGWSYSNKSRHIRAKYFDILEQIEEGTIAIIATPTEEMIADGLTKPLTGQTFKCRMGIVVT
jgi:hypothetical protein